MNITRKDLTDCEVEFTVTTDQSDVKVAQTLALEILGQDINVPGFRPGKAPVNEIRKRVGEYRLLQETLEQLVERAYRRILQEHNVFPLTQPKVDIKNQEALARLDTDQPGQAKGEAGVEFVFIITERPKPELPDYKNLGVTYEKPNITPEKTQEALDGLFAQWKEGEEGKQQTQDETDIQTAVSLEDAKQQASQSPESSQSQMSPKLTSKDKPDDEWAQVLGAENLEDLTKRLQANLTLEHMYISGNKFTQDTLDALKERTELILPNKLIQHDLEHQEQHKVEELEKVGLDLEGYAKKQKMSVDELKKQWRTDLEREYAIEFITAVIAEKESISVSDDELNAEINASKEPNAKKLFQDPDRREHLRYLMRRDKVIRQLVEWNLPKDSAEKQ